MSESLRQYLDFAVETAYQAGKLTLGYFQTGVRPDVKADDTPVTVADRRAEQLVRGRIEKRFPGHAIVGEEFGVKESGGESHRWFIDPIDGTATFVSGAPYFSVLIGLEIEGRVEVGVAYYPALDQMLAAASGEGCWWNGRRAHVSAVSNMAEAVVAYSDDADFGAHGRAEAWDRISRATKSSRDWGDGYGYLLVATGRAEVNLDPFMDAWDCGPFPPILREAGGFFGDWQGNVTIYGGEAMATTHTLLPELLALIRGPDDGD
jgi:myo-inositol-1(or 4)-monophosphatase